MDFFEDVDWHYVIFMMLLSVMVGILVFSVVQPHEYYELTGIVMDKQYTPSRSWTTITTTCDSNGNCTPHVKNNYESEHYDLLVMLNDSVSSYRVSSEKYALTSIGDKVVFSCSRGKIMKIEHCGVK